MNVSGGSMLVHILASTDVADPKLETPFAGFNPDIALYGMNADMHILHPSTVVHTSSPSAVKQKRSRQHKGIDALSPGLVTIRVAGSGILREPELVQRLVTRRCGSCVDVQKCRAISIGLDRMHSGLLMGNPDERGSGAQDMYLCGEHDHYGNCQNGNMSENTTSWCSPMVRGASKLLEPYPGQKKCPLKGTHHKRRPFHVLSDVAAECHNPAC